MTKKLSLEDALILNASRLARGVVRSLPLGVSLALGRFGGALTYRLSKRRVIAHRNLRAAFGRSLEEPELRSIARRSAENLGMSIVEMLRFPETDARYVERHVEVSGEDKFRPALEAGKGIIFLTGHFGNWEMLNIAGNLKGFPIVALARPQKHPRSDEFLNRLRTSKGSQVIRKGMPIREILRALRRGRIVGIVNDQDGGRRGAFVPFFGRLSSCPTGPAAFALRTGAVIFPIFIFRKDGADHRIEVEDPLEMPDPSTDPAEAERLILGRFCRILEAKIRTSPAQWLWAHRRWKSTPDRSVLVLSDGKAGHVNQSRAVVEALREERAAAGAPAERFSVTTAEIRYRSAFRRRTLTALALLLQGHVPFKRAWLDWALGRTAAKELLATYADIVVSCGASLVAVNRLVSAATRSRSVVVMKPYLPPAQFDAVIAPKHDRMKAAPNVFETEGAPSYFDTAASREAVSRLETEAGANGRPKIGLLVGGDADGVVFDPSLFEKVLTDLVAFAAQSGSVVLATSSRRTPAWADTLLKERLADRSLCPVLVIANEANRPGIVGGILGTSDTVLVSGESMSMVSEAVASGKPVVVFTPSRDARSKPKYREFLDRLERRGLILRALPGSLAEALRACRLAGGGARVASDRLVLREAAKKVA